MKNITLLLLLALAVSCKKGQTEFTISGHVMDMTTIQPIEGVAIEIVKISADSGEETPLSTVYTDENGKYSFQTIRDRFTSLEMRVIKDNYFSENQTVPFSDLSVKNTNYINFYTTVKSWVKIHLIHPQNDGAKFDIVKSIGKSACEECCPEGYQQFTGMVDTIFYCVNDANKEYKVSYFKHFSSFSGTKTVITPAMDTVDIVIEY